jgi:hypothetical protein
MRAAWMDRIPIKRKLAAMMVVVMTASFALSAAISGVYGYQSDRRAMEHHLNILASAIGDNCSAALVFDDEAAAAEILSALEFDQSITGAVLTDGRNVVVAKFRNGGSPVTGRDGIRVDRRIVVDGKTVGYLSIRAENAAIVGRLATEAVIAITAFVLGVLVALFLFEKLNHTIMAPLVELHETLRRVVRSRNYSIRATRKADDELSDVVMAVNDLLAQVEATTASSSLSSTPPTTPVRADAPVVSK